MAVNGRGKPATAAATVLLLLNASVMKNKNALPAANAR